MRVMKSMELSDDEKFDSVMPIEAPRPDYPWGLRICLTNDEIDKLGIDPSKATVGGQVMLHAMAKITSVNCDETESGEKYRIELQITDMAVDGDDEAEAPRRRSLSYDKNAA